MVEHESRASDGFTNERSLFFGGIQSIAIGFVHNAQDERRLSKKRDMLIIPEHTFLSQEKSIHPLPKTLLVLKGGVFSSKMIKYNQKSKDRYLLFAVYPNYN